MTYRIKFENEKKEIIIGFQKAKGPFQHSRNLFEESYQYEHDFTDRLLELGWKINKEFVEMHLLLFPPEFIFHDGHGKGNQVKLSYSKTHLDRYHSGWTWGGYCSQISYKLIPKRFITNYKNGSFAEKFSSIFGHKNFQPATEEKIFYLNSTTAPKEIFSLDKVKNQNLFSRLRPIKLLGIFGFSPDFETESEKWWVTREGLVRESKVWGKVGGNGEWLMLKGQRTVISTFQENVYGLLVKNFWEGWEGKKLCLTEKGIFEEVFDWDGDNYILNGILHERENYVPAFFPPE